MIGDELRKLTGLNPDFSFLMDQKTFKKFFDQTVDKVKINLDEKIEYQEITNTAEPGKSSFVMKKGEHEINAEQVLLLTQSRKTSGQNDYSGITRKR